MLSDSVILQNVGKCYHLYNKPIHRLYQMILRGKKNFYHEFWALKNISLKIKKGETVGIIGKNGSGKSTLLQLIAGILKPSEGVITINGKVSALIELGAGFHGEFTGRENVYIYCSVLGLDKYEIDSIIEDIIAFADIGEFIDQPVKFYSSGMFVRLAFSAAVSVRPEILIVDEALAVGDISFQQKCLNKIRKMQEDGVTIILVTHSTNILIEYCNRGIYLRDGRLIMDGSCRDVVKHYTDDLVDIEGGCTLSIHDLNESSGDQKNIEENNCKDNVIVELKKPSIYFLSVKFYDNEREKINFLFGDVVRIVMNIKVTNKVSEPCFGIQISSPDGIVLWSNTTQHMNINLAELNPGVYCFEWQIKCNFNAGRYVVALGVGEIVNGEYNRHHRLDYAGFFDVNYIKGMGSGWLAPFAKFRQR